MAIVLARVDDRLIHGQVVVGWTRAVRATHIVVADDEVSKDKTQVMLLKMAAPVGVKASILSVDEAIKKLLSNDLKNDRVLLLVSGPKSLLRLIEGGVSLKEVIIGNVRIAEGRIRITKEVAASKEEIEYWKKLDNINITLKAQWLPDSKPTDFNQIIRKY